MQTENSIFNRTSIIIPTKCRPFVHQNINHEIKLIQAFQNVLDLQVCLINQLSLNKNLITEFVRNNSKGVLHNKTKSTDAPTERISPLGINKSDSMSQNPSCSRNKHDAYQKENRIMRARKSKKISKKTSSGSNYMPSNQVSQYGLTKTSRQTKHIPKNYGKGIINYILKNKEIVANICQKQGTPVEEILKVAQIYKDKIYTVAHLRSMWVETENKNAKIFRILSTLYLRKHCLEYIFNSRVQHHNLHIKYRYRMMQAVKNPESFTRIKEY